MKDEKTVHKVDGSSKTDENQVHKADGASIMDENSTKSII